MARESVVTEMRKRPMTPAPHKRRWSDRVDRLTAHAMSTPAISLVPAPPIQQGPSDERTPEPTTVVIFGASGDLTKRKLVPALYNLARDGSLPRR